MSTLSAIRISRAPLSALVAVGVAWGTLSSLMPDIKAQVGASDAQLGLALMFSAFGSIASMYLSPQVGQWLGRHTLPVLGLFLFAAFYYPLVPSTPVVLAPAFFLVGASVAMIDINANVRISQLETRHALHLMNINHAAFSFAFAAAAAAAGFGRRAGLAPVHLLPTMSLIALVLVWLMWRWRRPGGDGDIGASGEDAAAAAPWGPIMLTALVLFGAFVGENATEAWSALHIERTLGAAAGVGGFGPAMLGLSMGIGRLGGQVMANRLGEVRLIVWSALLGVTGALIMALAPSAVVAVAGVAVLGAGMAVIVPSVNSVLGRLVSERQRAHAISRAWLFGMAGFFIGPAVVGVIAEGLGLRAAFAAVAVVVGLLIPAALALGRR